MNILTPVGSFVYSSIPIGRGQGSGEIEMDTLHDFVAIETMQVFLVRKYFKCTEFRTPDIDGCDWVLWGAALLLQVSLAEIELLYLCDSLQLATQ